jgi:hypothetical protein
LPLQFWVQRFLQTAQPDKQMRRRDELMPPARRLSGSNLLREFKTDGNVWHDDPLFYPLMTRMARINVAE